MQQHLLKPLIISALEEIEYSLDKYGFGDLLNDTLVSLFMKSFVFDVGNECIWCWDIAEYIDTALKYGYITEQEREDFLLAYLLNV